MYFVQRDGVFYDRERLFPWLFLGVAILVIGSGWRRILELVLYWVPFFLLWVAYDLIRGQADNGRSVATTQPITAEKALFLGKVPNNVLQDRFYVPQQVQWWEALTGITYMSHFFVVYTTAAVLFIRNRERFVRWMTALVLLTVFGLLGYWLYPMAPPWMAADQGLICPIWPARVPVDCASCTSRSPTGCGCTARTTPTWSTPWRPCRRCTRATRCCSAGSSSSAPGAAG